MYRGWGCIGILGSRVYGFGFRAEVLRFRVQMFRGCVRD